MYDNSCSNKSILLSVLTENLFLFFFLSIFDLLSQHLHKSEPVINILLTQELLQNLVDVSIIQRYIRHERNSRVVSSPARLP